MEERVESRESKLNEFDSEEGWSGPNEMWETEEEEQGKEVLLELL
jgi:hypothetical protein